MANIVITKEILDAGRSCRGSWSMKQIKLFGISSSSVSLPRTVIGNKFPEELIQEFLALKDKHLTPEQILAAENKKISVKKKNSTIQKNNPAIPIQPNPDSVSFNIIMSDHIIEKAKSSYGGWSRKQLELIGVNCINEAGMFRVPSGWQQSVIGKEYPNTIIEEFIKLKDQHLSSKEVKVIANTLPELNLDLDI